MIILLLTLWGCAPSCEDTCDKLISCEAEDSPNLTLSECISSCSAQEELYEKWDDLQKREDFSELKNCIVDSECSDVVIGVCYEDAEDLYIW